MRGSFQTTINYTACNEDWTSELAALELNREDEVLCVTASGDRPLHMLLGGPRRVVTIDSNILQNDVFRLKADALRFLDYAGYAELLGLRPSTRRAELLATLRRHCLWLAPDSCRLPEQMIARGILYEGRWERWYRTITWFPKQLRPGVIEGLFEFTDLKQQQHYVESVWHRKWWRTISVASSHPALSRMFFRDPGLSENIHPSIGQPGAYMYDRMKQCMLRTLAQSNFMLRLIFLGSFDNRALPAYLEECNFENLKNRVDTIETVTGDLLSYLKKTPAATFSKFSLSDLVSHLPEPVFHKLLEEVRRTAKPGARYCIRQFLSRHELPPALREVFIRDTGTEDTLRGQDRSFVYDFLVGHIVK